MSSKTRPDYPLPYLKLVKSGIPGFGIRIQLKESGILQSGYRFSDRNGAKTPPFGTAHTYVADLREYPPGFRLHLMSNTRYLILAVQPNLPDPNSPKIKRVTQGAFHLSEATGQPIPIVIRISLLIKTNHPDHSKPKYYVQRRWFFSKTSWKKPISLPKSLVRPRSRRPVLTFGKHRQLKKKKVGKTGLYFIFNNYFS